jgi:hypothetical protein
VREKWEEGPLDVFRGGKELDPLLGRAEFARGRAGEAEKVRVVGEADAADPAKATN